MELRWKWMEGLEVIRDFFARCPAYVPSSDSLKSSSE